LNLPAAFHRQRLDDDIAKLFIVINGAFVLVDDGQGKTARPGGLHFDERQFLRAFLQPSFQRIDASGKSLADRQRRTIAVACIRIHGGQVSLVELRETFRIVAGGVDVQPLFLLIDDTAGDAFGILDLHLFVQTDFGQLGPERRHRQTCQRDLDGMFDVGERHAADAGSEKTGLMKGHGDSP